MPKASQGDLLELFLANTKDYAIFLLGPDGRVASWNAGAQRLKGYRAEEIIGRQFALFYPPEDIATGKPERELQIAASDGRVEDEGWRVRQNGTRFWANVVITALRNPDGSLRGYGKITRDLSERRTSELNRNEEQLLAVFEAAPNGMILSDDKGSITLVNTAVERMFNYSRDELVGRSVDMLVPEAFRHGHPVLRQAYAAAPTTRAMGAGRDLFGMRKDGVEVPIEIGLNPISTQHGQFVLASIIDITGRKHAEQLRLANAGMTQHAAELEALNAELESFSYSVSHDLRAPVRAVLGYARAIEEDFASVLDDEGRRLLGVVQSEASRMGELIDDLLTFSRLGRQPMQHVPVNMTSLARDVVLEQVRLAGSRESIFDVADLPGVSGDRVLLRQVWANLISNAIKYSSKEVDPQLQIWATLEPARVVYHVRDNGVGFDMQYAGKLFGVFQRLHRSDEFPGTGVGLAIVQRIVRRHGGTVWAESRLGEGATFSFALPIGGDA